MEVAYNENNENSEIKFYETFDSMNLKENLLRGILNNKWKLILMINTLLVQVFVF